jgi:hypothetical protein
MFVYGVCTGSADRMAGTLLPSLDAYGLGPLLIRQNQASIFDAYNSIMDEAIQRWPSLEGLVFLHEDVAVQDPSFEHKLRAAFRDPAVGVVGAIGGCGQTEMSWWRTARENRHGHVGSPERLEDYSRGSHTVDAVDGLMIGVSPGFARGHRLRGDGYPGFHGYDSELCAQARAAGMRVLVVDVDLFHDHSPSGDHTLAFSWAEYEWMLRWQEPSWQSRVKWRAKRALLQLMARVQGPGAIAPTRLTVARGQR